MGEEFEGIGKAYLCRLLRYLESVQGDEPPDP